MTKEQLKLFIERNIPLVIKTKKKDSVKYVNPFISSYAIRIVIDVLAEKLSEELNKPESDGK